MTDRDAPIRRRELNRSHSNFATKTATDESNQLGRRWSLFSRGSPSPQVENRDPIGGVGDDGAWEDFDGSHRRASGSGGGAMSRMKAYFGLSDRSGVSGSRTRSARRSRGSGSVGRRDSEELFQVQLCYKASCIIYLYQSLRDRFDP